MLSSSKQGNVVFVIWLLLSLDSFSLANKDAKINFCVKIPKKMHYPLNRVVHFEVFTMCNKKSKYQAGIDITKIQNVFEEVFHFSFMYVIRY